MKKNKGISILKRVVNVVIELGCMEIFSRGIDKLTDRYTNTASKVGMRVGGAALGGYLGNKASEYVNDVIDRGVNLASKYVKLPEEEKTEEKENDQNG